MLASNSPGVEILVLAVWVAEVGSVLSTISSLVEFVRRYDALEDELPVQAV